MQDLLDRFPFFFEGTWVNILLLSISIVFMAGGAVNNGFSGFFFAIPFMILFLFQLRHFTLIQVMGILCLVLVLLIPLRWNQPENKLLYPYLGSVVEFQKEWGYEHYEDSHYTSLVPPKYAATSFDDEGRLLDIPTATRDTPTTMRMVRMEVSTADFGMQLKPIFEDSQGQRFSVYSRELFEGIDEGNVVSNDLKKVNRKPVLLGGFTENSDPLQSRWSQYLGNLMYWPMAPVIIYTEMEMTLKKDALAEVNKRSVLAKRVMTAIKKGTLTRYDNDELIEQGLIQDLYTNNGNKIVHGFGGQFLIKKEGETVHLVYEGIPAKDDCYTFYAFNDPRIFGFSETRIDGVENDVPVDSASMEAFKRKVCYSGKKSVTIEFVGSIGNIKRSIDFGSPPTPSTT